MLKLDYSLETPEERRKLVEQIVSENENLSTYYLEILADYLVFCMEKQEKKEKKILTENRMSTVNKRETSYEGLVAKFENGEDGIYNILDDNKYTIFQPKISITEKDLAEIPELDQTTKAIKFWQDVLETATGKDAFIAKKYLIEARKDQYIIKDAFRKPTNVTNLTHSTYHAKFECEEWIDEEGNIRYSGVSLMNPKVCSIILCNYSRLKQDCYGIFDGDMWYLMEEFDTTSTEALKDYPLLERIVLYKIDGLQNTTIQEKLEEEFGVKHSIEYISSLWRKKIPVMIASAAEDIFLRNWYLNVEKGKYKKCSRCGEIKLAHNKYFSKNKTSKDGFYSICKKCRNAEKRFKQIDGFRR
jgi:hypothetical protein